MSPSILREAAARYGVDAGDLVARDGFESFIFETAIAGVPAILRIGHSRRRPETMVRAEMDWLAYLAGAEIDVAVPLPSAGGAWVEGIDDGHGDHFVTAAFRLARGRAPDTEDWEPSLWQRYGRLLGRMHTAALGYEPSPGTRRRPHWDDDVMLGDVFAFLPADEPAARESLDRVLEHIESLSRDDGYGLIHQDAHTGNFYVADDGTITMFDFDDCCYSWFVNDIAIVVFYALSWDGWSDPEAATTTFWPSFWAGYSAEHRLEERWLAEIPWFIKLREIDTYAIIHRSMDLNAIDDPWARRFMAGRRERINGDVPVIDLDFRTLAS